MFARSLINFSLQGRKVFTEQRRTQVDYISRLELFKKPSEIDAWKEHNKKIYPPQLPGEAPRPAFVCHYRQNFKYSHKKLWYIACLVRGLSVDEALRQLTFINKKGAICIKETIEDAIDIAVNEHNVEYRSNLWVSESFTSKGFVIKGIRRHAKKRPGLVEYRYSNYFVTLEEGQPPKDYYYFNRQKSGDELLAEWLQQMRMRKIYQTL